MMPPALAPPAMIDAATTARIILASRSEEQAVAEVARLLTRAREEGRASAADDLAALHDRFSRTYLQGRVLGVILECSRYVRDGSLAWLDNTIRSERPPRGETPPAERDAYAWLPPHERVVPMPDKARSTNARSKCKTPNCEAEFNPRPPGHKGRSFAYCEDHRTGGLP